jgi:dipeptidyl aminopeptidase/acylaminoacyl peptidase
MNLSKIPEIDKIENITLESGLHSNSNETLEVINIFYKSDKYIVQGYILKKKILSKKIPVIIYCRGGNNSNKYAMFGEVSISSLQKKEFIYMAENEKAIIFFPNYRGSSMSEGNDEFGGGDVNDIINLYPIISKYKYCDKTKISLYGWSRGGMMAIIVATKVDWIKKIILGGTMYSMIKVTKERPDMKKMWDEVFHLTKADYKTRAPKYLIDKIPKNISFLILHGSNDTAVDVSHTYLLAKKCQKNNLLYKLIIFPDGDHGLTKYRNDVMREVISFLN